MAKINTRGNRAAQTGNRITRRGLPKKSGGIGLHVTGKARRRFKSNMQKRKVRFSDGTVRRMWVRVRDLKSGLYDNPNKKDFAKVKA
ncbi:MAG: 50S ribosomal protein L28 [Lentisphaerae bacterium]|nr:50S ribosomal protein L28 [Lentisphaerota bacterium]